MTAIAPEGSLPADAGPLGPAASKPNLSEAHLRQLREGSGLSDEIIAERGYRTATIKADLARLGFGKSQLRVPALVIPLHNVHGEQAGYQIRPDQPREKDGKALKYETPSRSRPILDIPPRARAQVDDPSTPLFITEGSKKADAAADRGLCCISLQGVYSWRGRNEKGGSTALGDWESIALKGRTVFLAFDSDIVTKKPVREALHRLKEFLARRGAKVRIVLLPHGEGGRKVGLDDFFLAGHAVEQLLACAVEEIEDPVSRDSDGTYWATPNGVFRWANIGNSAVAQQMSSFVAKIVHDVERDDGVERTRVFDLEVELAGAFQRISVPAKDFLSLDWVLPQLGARAIIEPGEEKQLGPAIQSLSDPACKSIYAHTGWQTIGGRDCFLHADGAVGAVGAVPDVEVDLPRQLLPLRLPDVPDRNELIAAIRASLEMTQIGPAWVAFPMLLAAYRAPLGDVPWAIFLTGRTGTRKTAWAACTQQHFGAGYDATSLPGNWSSTANANEELLFLGADVVVVIDDFVPPAGQDRGRLDAAADRIVRNAANGAGRQRMRRDGSLRPERPCRALVLSTGELLPRGHSLRARMVVLELGLGDVDLERLTACQRAAKEELFAAAMAAYVQWLAEDLEGVRATHRQRVAELRREIGGEMAHGRTVDAIADLWFVLDLLLEFAAEMGAVDATEHARLLQEGREALLHTARAQGAQQADADSVDQFRRLVRDVLAAGRAHLDDAETVTGPPRGLAEHCGWVRGGSAEGRLEPRGDRIGWIGERDVYLLPDATEAVVQRLARDQGDSLLLTGRALRKQLHERGALASVERHGDETRFTVRRSFRGGRPYVLHLHADWLWLDDSQPPPGPHQPRQTDASQALDRSTGGAVDSDDRTNRARSALDRATLSERRVPQDGVPPLDLHTPRPTSVGGELPVQLGELVAELTGINPAHASAVDLRVRGLCRWAGRDAAEAECQRHWDALVAGKTLSLEVLQVIVDGAHHGREIGLPRQPMTSIVECQRTVRADKGGAA